MTKKLFLFAIISILLLSVTACQDTVTVTDIRIKEGSIKYTFDVDESFCYDTAIVETVYSDGTITEDRIDSSSLSRFDTSTTGEKEGTVLYNGKTMTFPYEVTNISAPSKDIVTTARLTLDQAPYPTGISRVIELSKGDRETIFAVSFTLKGTAPLCNGTLATVEFISLYEVEKILVNDKTLKVIIYGGDGIADGEILTVNFAGNIEGEISLSSILISDGTVDYDLPTTKGV